MYSSKTCKVPANDGSLDRHGRIRLLTACAVLALISFSAWGCYTILTHPRVGSLSDRQVLPPDSVATADPASLGEERVDVGGDCLRCHTGRHIAAYYNDPFYDGHASYSAEDRWSVPRRAGTYDPYYDRWRSYSSYPWWLSRESDYYGSSRSALGWYYSPTRLTAFSAAQKDSVERARMLLQERDRRWERLGRLPSTGFRLPITASSPSEAVKVAAKRDSVGSSSPSPSSETTPKPAAEDEKTPEEKRSDKRKSWRKGKGLN